MVLKAAGYTHGSFGNIVNKPLSLAYRNKMIEKLVV